MTTLSFKAEEWVQLAGRGWVALVEPYTELTPAEADTLKPGAQVRIDMCDYTLKGIERFATFFWYRHKFGLLIEGEPKTETRS